MRLAACLLLLLALAGAGRADDARPDAPVANTYWKLVTVGGAPAVTAENRREAHVILRLDGSLGGSTGCNAMTGTWKIDGATLTLGPIATTRMFCAGTATERAFAAALNAARGWRVNGDDMTLSDASGAPLATFTAIYF